MTSHLPLRQGEVINAISHRNRESAGAQVERNLNRAGAVAIETLDQDGGSPQNQGLREAQFQYPQEDAQEVDRHGARDPGQIHLKPGSQNRDQQVANKLGDVPARRLDRSVKEHTRARRDDKADKQLGPSAQVSPRLSAATHFPPCTTPSWPMGGLLGFES